MWSLVNRLANFDTFEDFFWLYKIKSSSFNKVIFLRQVLYFGVPQTISMWKDLFKNCQPAEKN